MPIGTHDPNERVFIVAEIGNNHQGGRNVAEELIVRASESGVDAVKFQMFDPDHYVSRFDQQRIARLQKFRLSADDFALSRDCSQDERSAFVFYTFDLSSVSLLDPLAPVFKIASGDNTFYALLESAADTGKSIILSEGLVTLGELQVAVNKIEARWTIHGANPALAVLHCV